MGIDLGPLFAAGLLAGWGVAVPLGAIGLLLVRQALLGGFRAGAAAAVAVALVDGAYCVAAVAIGAVASPLIASWGAAPQVGAGLVLMAVAGFGLVRRSPAPERETEPELRPSPGRIFVIFGGLTVINPATLLYFGALTAALPRSLGLAAAPAVFVAGVVAASLTWQLALAAAAAAGAGRISTRGQAVLGACGYGLVGALGAGAVIAALVRPWPG